MNSHTVVLQHLKTLGYEVITDNWLTFLTLVWWCVVFFSIIHFAKRLNEFQVVKKLLK